MGDKVSVKRGGRLPLYSNANRSAETACVTTEMGNNQLSALSLYSDHLVPRKREPVSCFIYSFYIGKQEHKATTIIAFVLRRLDLRLTLLDRLFCLQGIL